MTALRFQNEEALRIALTSGLVPSEVQAAPADVVRFDDGALSVTPSVVLSETARRSLRTAGAQSEAGSLTGRPVSCWAQVITPRRVAETEQVPALVLFAVPHQESPLQLAGEMLRLGCDRQEYCFPEGHPDIAAWVRVVQPPYYTVSQVLDRVGGTRAFVPSPPGQRAVWTELGYQHPLAHLVKPRGGECVLIQGDGAWTRLPEHRWTDIYQLIDLAVPGTPVVLAATPPRTRLPVMLRLTRAARAVAPSLWVLRDKAVAQVDSLVQTLPDDVIDGLQFAAASDVVLLRAKAGSEAPPELAITAQSYVPLSGFRNLFLPSNTIIEPPLRKDRLRDLLAPDPDRVFWLQPTEGAVFRADSIALSAFTALSDWVDYVVHSHAPALEPWVRAATFEFEAFESIGGEWGAEPAAPVKEEEPPDAHHHRRRTSPPREHRTERSVEAPAPPALVESFTVSHASVTVDERRLAAVERGFLASTAPADDPSRQTYWLTMAQLHTRLRHSREAGLCWTRAIWEHASPDVAGLSRLWVDAEAHLAGVDPGALLPTLLARKSPSQDETRALAAYVTWAARHPTGLPVDTQIVQGWLDAHDDNLDVRSLWMVRSALAEYVGGDRLGLTRARDRIFARLQRGLSLARDVPAFLRFSSRAASDVAGAKQIVEALDALLQKFETTKRRRSVVEARPELTRAYVQFVFAYGFARLGQTDRAKALRRQAIEGLDTKDPVHGFLTRAFGSRIDQALEGLPLETPLPQAVAAELAAIDPKLRYVIEEIRSYSTILEAHETLEIWDGFLRVNQGAADPRGVEFAGLRGLTDTERLGQEIERLTKLAVSAPAADRRRLFAGIIDFLPSLPESRAMAQLQVLSQSLVPFAPGDRAAIIEKLLLVTAYFGRADLAEPLATRLAALIPELTAEEASTLAQTMSRCVRSLRRVSLRREAATIIERLLSRIEGKGPQVMATCLHLAGGLASLGQLEASRRFFETGSTLLRGVLTIQDRRPLARAFSLAASQTEPAFALARIPPLAERLADVTDSLSTYKYVCVSVVHFMESLVLGLASEELELGESGRRWLDDDEFLVRRRIHRELKEQG